MAVFDSLETLLRYIWHQKRKTSGIRVGIPQLILGILRKGAIYKPPSKNQLFESAINKPDRHPCGDFSLDLRHPHSPPRFQSTIPENARMDMPVPRTHMVCTFLAQPLRFCSRQCTFATAPEPVGSPALRSVVQPALGSAELVRLWNSPLTTILPVDYMEKTRNKPRVEEQVNHLPIRPNRIAIMTTLRQSEMR